MRWPILLAASALALSAHDLISTPITFDREIIRIVYARCASCHRPGGRAFSLLTYKDARPWAEAIKEETLTRRMPPWGAVKGFGEFRNDAALTPEQVELIVSWAQGGVPEGEEKDLPMPPKVVPEPPRASKGAVTATAGTRLPKALRLDGIEPLKVPDHATARISAQLPDGTVEPLLWLEDYRSAFRHSFLYRSPIDLPAGTTILGIPEGMSFSLWPTGK